jgi:hypothetical protein
MLWLPTIPRRYGCPCRCVPGGRVPITSAEECTSVFQLIASVTRRRRRKRLAPSVGRSSRGLSCPGGSGRSRSTTRGGVIAQPEPLIWITDGNGTDVRHPGFWHETAVNVIAALPIAGHEHGIEGSRAVRFFEMPMIRALQPSFG